MKHTSSRLRGGPGSEALRRMLAAGRTFAVLSLGSALFFILIGLALMARGAYADSPAATMKGFAASVSDALFSDMLGMELISFKRDDGPHALSAATTAAFLVRILTDVNPGDPRSLLAGEVAGLGGEDAVLLRSGIATDADEGPADVRPLPSGSGGSGHPADGEPPAGEGDAPGLDDLIGLDGVADPGDDPADGADGPGGEADGGSRPGRQEPGSGTGSGGDGGAREPAKPTTGGRKVVFIYHSHNRESWKPELGGKNAESKTKNITLVGKRLASQLEKRGVGALSSSDDYPTKVKDYRWELSYNYSLETVKEAMAGHRDLAFFFDIHRDSQSRSYTTATIGGKDYAQVYFIVGHRNPNWRKNEAFATELHEAMEKKLPGISRGVWGKTAANGNGEYNQHVSPESVVVEIGGVDNTLQECYRTADALADVIAELYWKAEKVGAAKS